MDSIASENRLHIYTFQAVNSVKIGLLKKKSKLVLKMLKQT